MDIEQYYESPEGLNQLLREYASCFSEIQKHEVYLKENRLTDLYSLNEAISRLTGVAMSLQVVSDISKFQKDKRHSVYYYNSKMTADAENKKTVATSLDKEADVHVLDYTRICTIFEAYLKSCTQGIMSCQSIKKGLENERKSA